MRGHATSSTLKPKKKEKKTFNVFYPNPIFSTDYCITDSLYILRLILCSVIVIS